MKGYLEGARSLTTDRIAGNVSDQCCDIFCRCVRFICILHARQAHFVVSINNSQLAISRGEENGAGAEARVSSS